MEPRKRLPQSVIVVAVIQLIVISIKIENINARVHKGLTGLECIRLI
ncbi:hypothetical protein MAN88_22620 [Microcystis aeruginosa]|nr:hypothetical protein MAN88_22620 [Microcystis aeruginosa]